jgi:RNA polymerase sigma factor (sigma-70 family)
MVATAEAETAPPPAHALLAAVDGWLWTLATRAAKKYRLDVDDVHQEAVLVLLKSAARYDPARGAPTTWASWVVRRAVADLRRRRPREQPAEDLDHVPAREGEVERPDPGELAQVLQLLPAREQLLIRRRYGLDGRGGATQDEVALEVGGVRQNISRLERRALRRLKVVLVDDGDPSHPTPTRILVRRRPSA